MLKMLALYLYLIVHSSAMRVTVSRNPCFVRQWVEFRFDFGEAVNALIASSTGININEMALEVRRDNTVLARQALSRELTFSIEFVGEHIYEFATVTGSGAAASTQASAQVKLQALDFSMDAVWRVAGGYNREFTAPGFELKAKATALSQQPIFVRAAQRLPAQRAILLMTNGALAAEALNAIYTLRMAGLDRHLLLIALDRLVSLFDLLHNLTASVVVFNQKGRF